MRVFCQEEDNETQHYESHHEPKATNDNISHTHIFEK